MKKNNTVENIVDAHMHLWDRVNGYPWLDETIFKGKLLGNFLIDDYLKIIRDKNITKSVHVECHGFAHDPVLETQWVQKIADKHGFPQGIVGYAPLHHSDVDKMLKRHCEYPNMRGIRMNLRFGKEGFFLTDRGDYMRDKAWRKGFSLLSKYNLSFDMQIYPQQIPDAVELLKTYKETIVIFDHLSLPHNPSEKTFPDWLQNIQLLAEIPNAYMKVSGIGVFFQGTQQRDLIKKHIAHAVDTFGPKRCIFASNCPPDGAFISLDDILAINKEALTRYSEEEQHLIFYENARSVYNL